ncbi:DUF2063 domain-containing protein [Pseudoalteromonas sp. NBT06-2]|uniref:HvfC family RiPP maturation protein n=1 Tax=Pseudoalteromonas sp. NBT06-2 TaxID=2025950 RepID=UPI000BA6F867|nr:putative DNA-binding domain-containing protein [Pseudoalteromonas sp. NBT06-2]PAJ73219.1 DUF2063 domain-containing protein [Pseudoalteromonas sp. NBT06-2]
MPHFKDVQSQFMAHIKDPAHIAPPSDIEPRRMAIYSELFFNNIEGFVASAFPVLKSLYDENDWLALVRQFFIAHDCKTPYFLEISQEFIEYLSNDYQITDKDPIFMLELAHYEWVELDISIRDEDESYTTFDPDILDLAPLYLSSLAWSLSYQFPVHIISPKYQPQIAPDEPSYIIVFRDCEDEVGFIAINGMTALMLQLINENPSISFDSLCIKLQNQVPSFSLDIIKQGAVSVLSALTEQGVLVTKK